MAARMCLCQAVHDDNNNDDENIALRTWEVQRDVP